MPKHSALPPRANEELIEYFEERRKRLPIVATTTTPRGQIVDWVPLESQYPDGKIATPPPPSDVPSLRREPTVRLAQFELLAKGVERGPTGTVPILRKDFTRIKATKSLKQYLSKRGGALVAKRSRGRLAPEDADPDPFGYFHATSGQNVTGFGCDGFLNVWTPFVENAGDHTIMQTGLQNYDRPKLQSLEAGWEISHDQYGDWNPHLFIYYTTNGYTKDGDNIGGYNTDVAGWAQFDPNIFPGALIAGTSTAGSTQVGIAIKYQLFAGRWWFQTQGIWLGSYPASLFLDTKKPGTTLGDHTDWAAFWGEVYSADGDPNASITQMGSGRFAEAGWTLACFQNNLRIQSDAAGTMVDHSGTPSAENSSYYDIDMHMNSGSSWGSFFFAGGPGDTLFERRILETGTTFLPETDGVWTMADHDRDGIPDLVFIKTSNTGTGRVEVHIASGSSKYKTRIQETGTTFLPETDGVWLMADYDRDGIPDLVLIKTSNTGTGRVEVHIASGSSNYQTRILETGTTFLPETDGVWMMADYDRDGIPDLVFIKTSNTGTGKVEVHIASGSSNFQSRILETGTTFLPENDGVWTMADYDRDGIPDLVFIKTSNTGTGKVEVHIASGSSNYQSRILETGTTFLPETDGTWLMYDYNRDGDPDLVFIKTSNTGTGTVEVHVASGGR